MLMRKTLVNNNYPSPSVGTAEHGGEAYHSDVIQMCDLRVPGVISCSGFVCSSTGSRS